MIGNLVWLFVFLGFVTLTSSFLVARTRLAFLVAALVCFLVATVIHILVMAGAV